MNRRERRAAVTRAKAAAAKTAASSLPADFADLMDEAKRAYHQGQPVEAEVICKQILERDPAHPTSINLLGVINQAAGRHRFAVKIFAKAIDLDELDAPIITTSRRHMKPSISVPRPRRTSRRRSRSA